MNKDQLRSLITETLNEIGLLSNPAVELLMGTAAQESRLGEYIEQINGPALGIMQMEPATFWDHVKWLDRNKPDLSFEIQDACNVMILQQDSLRFNLKFSIAMARVHYLRRPEPIPADLTGQAEYWKKIYNTYLGAGTVDEYIKHYRELVLND